MSRNLYFYAAACAIIFMCVELAFAQSLDTPQTRMRPIGSGSAVDQYRLPVSNLQPRTVAETTYRNQTAFDQSNVIRQVSTTRGEDSSVRQTVMLQQSGIVAPNLPNGNFNLPPDVAAGGSSTFGSPSPPPSLPTNPPIVSSGPSATSPLSNNPLPSNPPGFSPPPVSSSVLSSRAILHLSRNHNCRADSRRSTIATASLHQVPIRPPAGPDAVSPPAVTQHRLLTLHLKPTQLRQHRSHHKSSYQAESVR